MNRSNAIRWFGGIVATGAIGAAGVAGLGWLGGVPIATGFAAMWYAGFRHDAFREGEASRRISARLTLLESQFNASCDGLLVVNDQNRRTLTNTRMIEIFNVPRHIVEDPDDTALLKLVTSLTKDPERFVQRVKHLYDHQLERSADEVELKDGTVLDRYSSPVLGPQGQYYGRIWVFRDVTAQRRAEEENLKLSQAIRQTPTSVFILDLEGRIEYVNPAFRENYGYEPEEVIGRPMSIFRPKTGSQEVFAKLWEELKCGREWRGEIRSESKNGQIIWLLATTAPMRNAHGQTTHYLAIHENITELKRAEHERMELQGRLLEASRLAGMADVANGVLHNVGNVLNSINVSVAMVFEKLQRSSVSFLGQLAGLVKSHESDLGEFMTSDARGKKIPGFIGDLADALSAENSALIQEMRSVQQNLEHINEIVQLQQNIGGASAILEPLDMRDVFDDALKISGMALNRHGVQVVREFQDVPPTMADRHKVLQILINLVGNAKTAMAQSERKVMTCSVVKTEEGGVRVIVADTGSGISPENMNRLFTHGFTTKSDGHGFGLHSSILAAREMKTSLKASSDGEGRGARFTLEFPPQSVADASTAPVIAPVAAGKAA